MIVAGEIAAERSEMADLLGALPDRSWEVQTLCAGWNVRQLVAHLTMPFRYSKSRFAAEMVRSGGRFNQMADRCARRDAAIPAAELVCALRDNAANPWQPPGGGLTGALTHDVIHGLDLTVPLSADRRVPQDRLLVVLGSVTAPKSLKFFGTDLAGVGFRADDIDWSYGSGEQVLGTAQDLALALCGRKLPAGRLRGGPAARYTAAEIG